MAKHRMTGSRTKRRGPRAATTRRRPAAFLLAVLVAPALAACGTARFGTSAASPSTPPVSVSSASGRPSSGASSSAPVTPPHPTVATASATSGSPLARLTVLLDQSIRSFGGTHITVTQGVRTDRASALALGTPGDDAGEGRGVPVFLLQADGDFVADGVPIPYGAKPPTGHQLMVVVDARSLTVTDTGLSDAHADIRTLGPVFGLATTR